MHIPPGDANKNNSTQSRTDAPKNGKQSTWCGVAMPSFLAYLKKQTPEPAGSTSVALRVAQRKAQQAEKIE